MSSNQNKFFRLFKLIKQSLKGEEHDYTQGNVKTAILLLAVPMILELSLESVFAVVDIYFVGHLPNADVAVATVGLTEAVISLVYTLGIKGCLKELATRAMEICNNRAAIVIY